MDAVEFQESDSIAFEWTLRDLKNLFESSKGDAKSKVTKSTKFGGGRWQVLFYANSAPPDPPYPNDVSGVGYVSLFLSCEPTQEEKDVAYNGRWVREGLFRFTFEIYSLKKKELYNAKEAHNHSFSHATPNWGWYYNLARDLRQLELTCRRAHFASRDGVYYSKSMVKANDAFVIICTISSTPRPPELENEGELESKGSG